MLSGAHRRSVLFKYVDKAAISPGNIRKCHIDEAIDIANAERGKPGWQSSVGEGTYEVKVSVVDIHFVVRQIGSVQEVSRRLVCDRQARIHRALRHVVNGHDSRVEV